MQTLLRNTRNQYRENEVIPIATSTTVTPSFGSGSLPPKHLTFKKKKEFAIRKYTRGISQILLMHKPEKDPQAKKGRDGSLHPYMGRSGDGEEERLELLARTAEAMLVPTMDHGSPRNGIWNHASSFRDREKVHMPVRFAEGQERLCQEAIQGTAFPHPQPLPSNCICASPY